MGMTIRRVMTGLAILAAAAATIGGCGSDKPSVAPAVSTAPSLSPSASPSTGPSPQEYDGAQRLAGALIAAGVQCVNWDAVDEPIGALERGSCYVGTEEVVVSIHESHEDASLAPSEKAEILRDVAAVIMIVGANWTLSCDTLPMCKNIAAKVGGQVVFIPS